MNIYHCISRDYDDVHIAIIAAETELEAIWLYEDTYLRWGKPEEVLLLPYVAYTGVGTDAVILEEID